MIKAYFDGACEPNADFGKMGYGAVIYQHEEKIHEISHSYKRSDNIASNNIAEYCGIIATFKFLFQRSLEANEIYIFGDSKLVIEQLNGNWNINEGKYMPYAKIAQRMLAGFTQQPHLEWIPKERNIEADKLSRLKL